MLPQVKYHYYTMYTLQDMDLNQEFNQSVTEGGTRVTLYVSFTFVIGHKNVHFIFIVASMRVWCPFKPKQRKVCCQKDSTQLGLIQCVSNFKRGKKSAMANSVGYQDVKFNCIQYNICKQSNYTFELPHLQNNIYHILFKIITELSLSFLQFQTLSVSNIERALSFQWKGKSGKT